MDFDDMFRRVTIEVIGEEILELTKPVANYVPAVKAGKFVFVSGQGPFVSNKAVYKGKLGKDVDMETGYKSAQLCILNSIAILKAEIGTLNNIKRIVYLRGMVNSTSDFQNQPAVVNGASDTLVKIFGEKGCHARCAVSHNSLPDNIPTEIELFAEII